MPDHEDFRALQYLLQYTDRAVYELRQAELQARFAGASAVTQIVVAQALAVASDASRAVLEDLSPASAARRALEDGAPF